MDEQRKIREALGELLARAHMQGREDAIGWLVVVVDPELEEPVSSGYVNDDGELFASAQDAMLYAAEMDRTSVKYDDEPPWRHVVVPVFVNKKGA